MLRILWNKSTFIFLQNHFFRSEHWVVVTGIATVTVGENVQKVTVNGHVHITQQAKHRLENYTDNPVVLIEVQLGSYLREDDIIRYEDIYGRG